MYFREYTSHVRIFYTPFKPKSERVTTTYAAIVKSFYYLNAPTPTPTQFGKLSILQGEVPLGVFRMNVGPRIAKLTSEPWIFTFSFLLLV